LIIAQIIVKVSTLKYTERLTRRDLWLNNEIVTPRTLSVHASANKKPTIRKIPEQSAASSDAPVFILSI
jgi:hypothetical protein